MSVRSRPKSSQSQSQPPLTSSDGGATTSPDTGKPRPRKSLSFSQRALTSTANLANLLPTGTLLAFQLLTPIFTNNGSCDGATRHLTTGLLLLLAASCCLACFTDSFKSSSTGQVYYGFVTPKGLWLFDYPSTEEAIPDMSKYKLRFVDVVHAILSVLVFGAVALRDKSILGCLYPSPAHQTQEVLDIVPLGIGLICSMLFVVFPTRRHGIGYPVSS